MGGADLSRLLYEINDFKGSPMVVAVWLAYCALPGLLWFTFGMTGLLLLNKWFMAIHKIERQSRDH